MVFCGGTEAAQNQSLLCRLNIEYIVDLSSEDDDLNLKNRQFFIKKLNISAFIYT